MIRAKANTEKVATLKEWNDLHDMWCESENRAIKYKLLFWFSVFFLVLFLLTVIASENPTVSKEQTAKANETVNNLNRKNRCG
jgi:hypothetical protein